MEIETIKFNPGEKLITRPLVEKIRYILSGGRLTVQGDRRKTTFRFELGESSVLLLGQENRSDSGLLSADVCISAPNASSKMTGISEIELVGTFRQVEFIQETMCHKQSLIIHSSGGFTSRSKVEAELL